MKPTFLGLNVRRHPWLAGQLWAALVCPAFIVVELIEGHSLPQASIPVLIGLWMLGGVGFGAVMSVLAKSAANRRKG